MEAGRPGWPSGWPSWLWNASGRSELGYTIRRELWGQGLATEIGAALVTWHLTNAVQYPLYAHVAVANLASRRVVEKIGFEFVGQEDHLGVQCDLFRIRPDLSSR